MHFFIVAAISCPSITAYVCFNSMYFQLKIIGENIVILKCTPVMHPTEYIISPIQITNCLRHFSLIKKTHWMRYHRDPVRHDWNPSLLIQEVNLTAVPYQKKNQLFWVSMQKDFFLQFYVNSCNSLVLIYSYGFKERNNSFEGSYTFPYLKQ